MSNSKGNKKNRWFVDGISVNDFDFAAVRLIKVCDYKEDIFPYNVRTLEIPTALLEKDFLQTKKNFFDRCKKDSKNHFFRDPDEPVQKYKEVFIKQGAVYELSDDDFKSYALLVEKFSTKEEK